MLLTTIAVVPLAIYLLLIGGLHLRRRPLVTSGWRDLLTLGIACLGLAAVGPMQLFFPMHASALMPMLSWVMLFALYFLGLILFVLWSKPRLTVYGMTPAQFHQAVLQAAETVDAQANWNGRVLSLPQSGIQVALESSTTQRVHSMAAIGGLHDFSAWHQLERELVKAGHQMVTAPSRSGWLWVGTAIILLLASLFPVVLYPETAYAELKSFLWR